LAVLSATSFTSVKLPPAKPGVYRVSASKAPLPREPPEGGCLQSELQLVVAFVLGPLMLRCLAD